MMEIAAISSCFTSHDPAFFVHFLEIAGDASAVRTASRGFGV
jgi:hypothetical protein